MRNNWALRKNSRLAVYFHKLGIHHPDNMTGIIFDLFWRHLNGRPLELKKQIKFYKDSWKNYKEEKEN
jgi:hypothetical protein